MRRRPDPAAATVSTRTVRDFGLLMALVLAVVAGFRGWSGRADALYWLSASALFVMLALVWQAPLRPLAALWMAFAELLHRIVNPVLMALLFVLAVVPTGLLMKVFGRDPMRRRRQPDAATYWISRAGARETPGTMNDQF